MSNDQHKVNRRTLMKGGLSVGGAAILSGVLPALGLSSRLASTAAAQTIGGTLVFAGFQGYDALQPTGAWRKANHVALKSIYVSDNNETGTKVVAAERTGQQLDIIVYASGFTPEFEQEKILQPIDVTNIPNYGGLDGVFRSKYKSFWRDADARIVNSIVILLAGYYLRLVSGDIASHIL